MIGAWCLWVEHKRGAMLQAPIAAASGDAAAEARDVAADVDSYQSRIESGQCVQCPRPAADGMNRCATHALDQRARDAAYRRRKRAEWSAQGCCTRCGDKRRAAGSKWCQACRIELGKVRKPDVGTHVDKSSRIAARTLATVETCNGPTSGYEHKRYRGQDRRGRLSQCQENKTDLEEIVRCVKKALEGYEECERADVKALPRIQRQEARDAATSWVALLVRHGMQICERNKYPIPTFVHSSDEDEDDEE